MEGMKQVILVRKDLKMSKGKAAAQVAHAAVEAVLKSPTSMVSKWRKVGMKKVTLSVDCEKDLYKYLQMAKDNQLVTGLIVDAGHTELKPNTPTCLAIGPDNSKEIDTVTKDLKIY